MHITALRCNHVYYHQCWLYTNTHVNMFICVCISITQLIFALTVYYAGRIHWHFHLMFTSIHVHIYCICCTNDIELLLHVNSVLRYKCLHSCIRWFYDISVFVVQHDVNMYTLYILQFWKQGSHTLICLLYMSQVEFQSPYDR